MRRFAVLAMLATLLVPVQARAAVTPQNDAGTHQDAPDQPDPMFRIAPGAAYSGTIEGIGLDEIDYYAVLAPAGGTIDARASSPLGCLYIYDRAETQLAYTCTSGFAELGRATAVVPEAGTYYVAFTYVQAQTYWFSVGVDSPAPAPAPVDTSLGTGGSRLPSVAPATPRSKHVVVAVVDTGVNMYHQFFRAPALTAHPRTWLPGFPASAETVRLHLDAPDWAAANAADEDAFAAIERSTYATNGDLDEHLYTFPGTRIVGGISFGEYEDTTTLTAPEERPIRDDYGHGTHSAGLVAGANMPAADGNVLIVAVEVGKGTFDEGIRWAARQPWIDAISVSLGTVANVPLSGGIETVTRSPTCWHCVPVDVIGRTNVDSPVNDAFDGASSASGTSAATPNVAGHWAHLMLAARRGGITLKRKTVNEYLLHAAAPVAASAGAHDPSAYPASLADQGYGLVDQAAVNAAASRLFANSGPAPRPETETWFAHDRTIRIALWGPDVD